MRLRPLHSTRGIRGSASSPEVQPGCHLTTAAESSLDVEAEVDVTAVECGALKRTGYILIGRRGLAVRQQNLEPVTADLALDPDRPSQVRFHVIGKILIRRNDLRDDAERGTDHHHRADRDVE